jgi:ferredoxin
LRADGVPTVIVAVYGNREYEDALLELRDIVIEAGFVPVAGAAFIGEHSYDSSQTPIATGRPDQADLRAAEAFGRAVRVKVDGLAPPYGPPELWVPGNSPYRERHKEDVGAPTTLEELCTRCSECVLACPTGAIDANDPSKTDESACIFCAACVKACPEEARIWEVEWIRQVSRWLADNYSVRKEPEVYL